MNIENENDLQYALPWAFLFLLQIGVINVFATPTNERTMTAAPANAHV